MFVEENQPLLLLPHPLLLLHPHQIVLVHVVPLNGKVTTGVMMKITIVGVNGMVEIAVEMM